MRNKNESQFLTKEEQAKIEELCKQLMEKENPQLPKRKQGWGEWCLEKARNLLAGAAVIPGMPVLVHGYTDNPDDQLKGSYGALLEVILLGAALACNKKLKNIQGQKKQETIKLLNFIKEKYITLLEAQIKEKETVLETPNAHPNRTFTRGQEYSKASEEITALKHHIEFLKIKTTQITEEQAREKTNTLLPKIKELEPIEVVVEKFAPLPPPSPRAPRSISGSRVQNEQSPEWPPTMVPHHLRIERPAQPPFDSQFSVAAATEASHHDHSVLSTSHTPQPHDSRGPSPKTPLGSGLGTPPESPRKGRTHVELVTRGCGTAVTSPPSMPNTPRRGHTR